MNLGDAVVRGRCIVVVSDFEGDAKRVLEQGDRFLGVAEQEVDAAEVVQQAPEVAAVRELLVCGLGALRV